MHQVRIIEIVFFSFTKKNLNFPFLLVFQLEKKKLPLTEEKKFGKSKCKHQSNHRNRRGGLPVRIRTDCTATYEKHDFFLLRLSFFF